MKVELVKPQGYCAGVLNAIKVAYQAKNDNPEKNIYVLGMLVHNKIVIDELTKSGINTLEVQDDELPEIINQGDVVIFTAHGHSDKLENNAIKKGLIIYDATCPIVKNNLEKIKNEISKSKQVIYIGQKGHKESSAALSISPNVIFYDTKEGMDYAKISDSSPLVLNQTTLNFLSLKEIHEEIKNKLPNCNIENEICAATRLRQEAILKISDDVDLIIIVGDNKSSNSKKLFDIATSNLNGRSIMVENLDELKTYDLGIYKKAAIASGASTPIKVVNEIQSYLENNFR